MKELLTNSVFFGVMVSILTYELGMFLKRKLKLFHIIYHNYLNHKV